jgi:hypothetical protein
MWKLDSDDRTIGTVDTIINDKRTTPVFLRIASDEDVIRIWWHCAKYDDDIVGWEIQRFRENPHKQANRNQNYQGTIKQVLSNQWVPKGSFRIRYDKNASSLEKSSGEHVISGLPYGYRYCFNIRAVYSEDLSLISPFSNAIYFEAPLPPGWLRYYDPTSNQFFYSNLKVGVSQWYRPELDEYLLDETILLNFNSNELRVLKDLFHEEIVNFRVVQYDRMLDVLDEIGEEISKKKLGISKYFI